MEMHNITNPLTFMSYFTSHIEKKITYRNVIEIDNDEKLVSSDLRNIISCHALWSFYDHGEYKHKHSRIVS
jgi:hypothetical protein